MHYPKEIHLLILNTGYFWESHTYFALFLYLGGGRRARLESQSRGRKQGMLRGLGRGASRAEQVRYRRKYCGHGPESFKDDQRAKYGRMR